MTHLRKRCCEAFGLVYTGKSTRAKVWRKRGTWILTVFAWHSDIQMTFRWYSDNLLLYNIFWGHDRCLYPISNIYSTNDGICIQPPFNSYWLKVEYCLSPPGILKVRWALTRCFVQSRAALKYYVVHDKTNCIPFSSKLYMSLMGMGGLGWFILYCFKLERFEHAFWTQVSTCWNQYKLGRVQLVYQLLTLCAAEKQNLSPSAGKNHRPSRWHHCGEKSWLPVAWGLQGLTISEARVVFAQKMYGQEMK